MGQEGKKTPCQAHKALDIGRGLHKRGMHGTFGVTDTCSTTCTGAWVPRVRAWLLHTLACPRLLPGLGALQVLARDQPGCVDAFFVDAVQPCGGEAPVKRCSRAWPRQSLWIGSPGGGNQARDPSSKDGGGFGNHPQEVRGRGACTGAEAVQQTVRCGSGAEGPGVGGPDLLLHRNARRSSIWTGRAWKAPRFPALRFKKK